MFEFFEQHNIPIGGVLPFWEYRKRLINDFNGLGIGSEMVHVRQAISLYDELLAELSNNSSAVILLDDDDVLRGGLQPIQPTIKEALAKISAQPNKFVAITTNRSGWFTDGATKVGSMLHLSIKPDDYTGLGDTRVFMGLDRQTINRPIRPQRSLTKLFRDDKELDRFNRELMGFKNSLGDGNQGVRITSITDYAVESIFGPNLPLAFGLLLPFPNKEDGVTWATEAALPVHVAQIMEGVTNIDMLVNYRGKDEFWTPSNLNRTILEP